MNQSGWWVGCLLGCGLLLTAESQAQPTAKPAVAGAAAVRQLDQFERIALTDVYYSEGANGGDLNHDGKGDVVYGPYWFEGPTFQVKREIYPPKPQNREGYADNFFSWVYDFNGDGWGDVFVVGFPGTPAYVYENPGEAGLKTTKDAAGKETPVHWKKHQVFDSVNNESPAFTQLVGDERPELICTREGLFGYAAVNWERPFEPWVFHPISVPVNAPKFGHGLGVGDVNGDGRMDVIHPKGWYEQPKTAADKSRWTEHEASFTSAYGGAEMYAYDVDGDGDQDVITSLAAHDYGLAWYEQVRDGEEAKFQQHLIMGTHPSENAYGLVFTELHSVNLADIDGDGLKDIVTGKTYYSHHKGSPLWDAGAVVYWFKLVRGPKGVEWIPYGADGEAGIGRQVSVVDLNGDKLLEIVVGGMKGAHVLQHQRKTVDEPTYLAAQPKRYEGPAKPSAAGAMAIRGPKRMPPKETGKIKGALEGEALPKSATGGSAAPQGMEGFPADRWSGNSHLWWTGAKPGDTLTLELPGTAEMFDLELVLTCARDYGIVQLALNGDALGKPVDLYEVDVVTTGVLKFPGLKLKDGKNLLTLQIVGANDKAVKSHMVGVDYVRLLPEGKAGDDQTDGIKPKAADGRVLNLDFETGTLADWTATGDAFEGQPIEGDTVILRRRDMTSRHQGKFWIGGYEKKGDQGVGTLISKSFPVAHPFASFLANGGTNNQTRVELVRTDTNEVFFKSTGTESEVLRPVIVDLSKLQGKEIFVRLVDEHRGPWGHLNFDQFRFHDQKPVELQPAAVELAADEYPHAGLKAADAAKAMKLPAGFRALVGASEPDVRQPIAMALDDRGRVWIAEAYEYPIRAAEGKGRDRILIFEDRDGDGSLETKKVFIEGLNLVSGLEVGFGGVWVGAAPQFLFIPDADGDDKPDAAPKVLLDGWGYQDTHETLNAFLWGPDGWLYGCHGVFTHSKVGKPGTPDAERIPLNAAIWRYHPTRHEFDVFAHGTSNPWGVDFNDHGQAFCTACVIPHLYHIIQGARYQRQAGSHFNPYTYQDIVTIADHRHYLGATPHSGNGRSDNAGGGHAHAGAMIYLGGVWPAEYRGQIFMNNIHGQRLNRDLLRPSGSGYIGSHAPDFLLTGDRASQILNLRYGPDGQAWMIDWYDMQACHHGQVNLHDRSNGRIYKICFGESKSKPVDLARASDLELAETVLNANDWFVRHGRRLLQERAWKQGQKSGSIEPAAVKRLTELATSHPDDTRRLRAIWALHGIDRLTPALQMQLLQDASPYVRAWTVQLGTESRREAPPAQKTDWLQALTALAAADPSPVVRLYIASAAQRVPVEQRWELLAALVAHREDAKDHNLPLMYWYAAEPLAGSDPERALAFGMTAGAAIPLLQEFMLRRIGGTGGEQSLSLLLKGLSKASSSAAQKTFLSALLTSLRGQRQVTPPAEWAALSLKLKSDNDPKVRRLTGLLAVQFGDARQAAELRKQLADARTPLPQRREILKMLLLVRDPELLPQLSGLMEEAGLRDLVLPGLVEYDSPLTGKLLLSAYGRLNPGEKRLALQTLCSRLGLAQELLTAIEQKQIPATDLTADLVRQLQFLKNEALQERLAKSWGTVRESAADKAALIAETRKVVSDGAGDPVLGRAVFAKTCQRCHLLYGIGAKVGPDLTGSNRSNLDYLLSNIIDPSAVMAKEYQQTVIETENGRVVAGILRAEDDRSVTLQTAEATVVIPTSEIAERVLSEKSMMPDDQLRQFSPAEVKALFAYLSGRSQVPMLATPDNAALLFNGQDLTGWNGEEDLWSVENGEIVGKTSGLKENEFLVSDLAAGDFRLQFEVLLVKNEGNSGVQFRSEALEHDVKGYQADIGVGWWGKLYEEHGRALLWDKSGEPHVKPGEWNRYEIEATGSRIRTWINGQLCVDLDDPAGAKQGVFALQLHSGGPTEVRFRNLKLILPGGKTANAVSEGAPAATAK